MRSNYFSNNFLVLFSIPRLGLTSKRYEIGCQLLLITNRKSHTVFRLVPTLVTFNDLERRNSLFCFISSNLIALQVYYVTVVEDILIDL